MQSSKFNPYYTWLQIVSNDQPPNHYELLGLRSFESDRELIAQAADQRVSHLRQQIVIEHKQDYQRVLKEVGTARNCLLDSTAKLKYDESLRRRAAETTQSQVKRPPPPPRQSSNSPDSPIAVPMTPPVPNSSLKPAPFGTNNFAENPEPRVPCVLLIDVSLSMTGRRTTELRQGLATLKHELQKDQLASKRAEIAIVTFGEKVEVASDFTLAPQLEIPELHPAGQTPMGHAVNLAIDMIEGRKRVYKSNGLSYYRPWIFLITDGAPNDVGVWEAAAARAMKCQENKLLALFAVGVAEANLEVLKMFSQRDPLQLKGLQFKEMFMWLSSSLRTISQSSPSENYSLPSPSGWASLD
jgi:uncharacterized protein YegL